MNALLQQVGILLIILSVGFIIRKLGVLDKKNTTGLSSLLIKVTLPALIFISMQKEFTSELLNQSLVMTGLGFAVYVLFIAVSLIVSKFLGRSDSEKGMLAFSLTFANVGFMGFPVLLSIWGEDSIFYGALFNIPFHFLLFSLGVAYLTRGHQKDRVFHPAQLLSPGIIATITGFLFFLLNIPLPVVIREPLTAIGDTTIPLSMLALGSMLTEVHWKDIVVQWRPYVISFIRLLIFPVLLFIILKWLGVDQYIRNIIVVLSAMPVAVNAPLMAAEYHNDELFASRVVFLSTILSLITLPVILWMINSF